MPNAALKFTQGSYTDSPGRAVKGRQAAGAVTCSNGDNTNVLAWEFALLDTPSKSAIQPGVFQAMSGVSTGTFTPDAAGDYRVFLTVKDATGTIASDIRVFSARNERLLASPSYLSQASENNFGGSSEGWNQQRDEIDSDLFANLSYAIFRINLSSGVVSGVRTGNPNVVANGSQFTLSALGTGSWTITWDSSLELPTNFMVSANIQGAPTGSFTASDIHSVRAVRVDATTVRVLCIDGTFAPVNSSSDILLIIHPRP